jgi:hypothetical protein
MASHVFGSRHHGRLGTGDTGAFSVSPRFRVLALGVFLDLESVRRAVALRILVVLTQGVPIDVWIVLRGKISLFDLRSARQTRPSRVSVFDFTQVGEIADGLRVE